jgi:hypothetical protein
LVREALSDLRTQVVAVVAILVTGLLASSSPIAARPALTGEDAVAVALLFGRPMPPPETTARLPAALQGQLAEYRKREATFHSGLTPPPGATPDEQRSFEQRVGIERVVFSLFDRKDSARIASLYALDVDVSGDWDNSAEMPRREANFINDLLRELPQPWLAPYLNLIAGHRRLCAARMVGEDPQDAQRAAGQLKVAARAGHPLIRAVADHLITTARPCSPSP